MLKPELRPRGAGRLQCPSRDGSSPCAAIEAGRWLLAAQRRVHRCRIRSGCGRSIHGTCGRRHGGPRSPAGTRSRRHSSLVPEVARCTKRASSKATSGGDSSPLNRAMVSAERRPVFSTASAPTRSALQSAENRTGSNPPQTAHRRCAREQGRLAQPGVPPVQRHRPSIQPRWPATTKSTGPSRAWPGRLSAGRRATVRDGARRLASDPGPG